ncbi:Ni/Fe-hydrogenase cytochrome b subunit [bacterium]|nr:Ni/Fe-hydrogenase cytochrome b subunit [bacterium]MBU1636604.1 Ni/Fe-hydrogenase cytochrome b subunit [bacterium]MBU1921017.1 Ni/Fe-hydrogenase cytochrome b subunit [bacterium]
MTQAKSKASFGLIVLRLLALLGIVLIVYRFANGLGSVTNLSDGYPWGFWIGFDILAGIALAAGGFVMAGTIHIFGGSKYHPLVRPAILTAFLGYLLFIFGLCVDLGRPWNLWIAIISWNHASPMFEVAWCVMLYTSVLALEFLPVIFERYKLTGLHAIWKALVPWIIIGMLSLFTLAMTYSVVWMLIIGGILLFWEIMMKAGLMPRDKQMPILLIMAGIMFSFMHQSSLGSLFLLAPTKLSALWYSPILPLLFLLSAITVAPAMVIFESLASEKALGHKTEFSLLAGLAKAMPYLLSFYLLLRVADLVGRYSVADAFTLSGAAVSWWLEISIGIVIPLLLYLTPESRDSRRGLMWSSVFVIVGLIWHRLNVSVIGIKVQAWETYYPFWAEIFISVGIVSIGICAYRWAMLNLPICEHNSAESS